MARLQLAPEVVLRCGAVEAVLAPAAGGRITALRSIDAVRGVRTDWLVPLDDTVRATGFESTAWPKAGCYPLVPFSNRIRRGRFVWNGRSVLLPLHPGELHALHGGSQQWPWQLTQQQAGSATMAYRHVPDGFGWPWAFTAQQTVVLDAGGMTVAMQVRNESDETMPCGLGFHPYFPSRFGHRVRFDAGTMWPPDAEFLATAPRPLAAAEDHAAPRAMNADPFTQYYGDCAGVVELASEEGQALRIETDEALRHLVLHRPPLDAGDYFCVEPVSHVADAANLMHRGRTDTGWRILERGQTWGTTLRLRVSAGA